MQNKSISLVIRFDSHYYYFLLKKHPFRISLSH